MKHKTLMTQIYNPSDSKVHHNVNGTIYDIAPGATVDVKDDDVFDLMRLLGFLTVVSESSDNLTMQVVVKGGQIEEKEISKDEADKQFKQKKFACDLNVIKEGPGGVSISVPCDYKTTSLRALNAHKINDHKRAEAAGTISTRASEDGAVDETEDAPAKRRGRPPKIVSE